jgi:hypothetical protein
METNPLTKMIPWILKNALVSDFLMPAGFQICAHKTVNPQADYAPCRCLGTSRHPQALLKLAALGGSIMLINGLYPDSH